jgi:cyclophilin family peptidyl-prolyl cis-trans isomerase
VALTDTAASAPLITRSLNDPSGIVRYDALRAYSRRLARTRGCAPVVNATRDTHPHTALLALDSLAVLCVGDNRITALMDSVAQSLPTAADGQWHRAAHALVALARRVPFRGGELLSAFVLHPNPFVRTYAANAATIVKNAAVLSALSKDPDANVRAAAVEGLSRNVGHGADAVYIAQLTRDENQLIIAAVAAIDSTRNADAAVKLIDALDRLTTAKRENSRDGRDAILVRLRQVGSADLADRLRPYLRDFDPQIAARAADALQTWTGTRPVVQPSSPPTLPAVTFAEASALSTTHVVIQLTSGGEVEVELLPFDAPTNAARFARLVRRGYFDGLTLHRIAPNFVVQGGSPFANEYMGDALFTRDEVGLENWRGTVGLSTRRRDTGDGQLYFNLIDNVRLDHDYTIFGRVVRGMELVDAMLEGAVMRKVTVR